MCACVRACVCNLVCIRMWLASPSLPISPRSSHSESRVQALRVLVQIGFFQVESSKQCKLCKPQMAVVTSRGAAPSDPAPGATAKSKPSQTKGTRVVRRPSIALKVVSSGARLLFSTVLNAFKFEAALSSDPDHPHPPTHPPKTKVKSPG